MGFNVKINSRRVLERLAGAYGVDSGVLWAEILAEAVETGGDELVGKEFVGGGEEFLLAVGGKLVVGGDYILMLGGGDD